MFLSGFFTFYHTGLLLSVSNTDDYLLGYGGTDGTPLFGKSSLVNNLQKEHTQTHDATEALVVPSVRAAS